MDGALLGFGAMGDSHLNADQIVCAFTSKEKLKPWTPEKSNKLALTRHKNIKTRGRKRSEETTETTHLSLAHLKPCSARTRIGPRTPCSAGSGTRTWTVRGEPSCEKR